MRREKCSKKKCGGYFNSQKESLIGELYLLSFSGLAVSGLKGENHRFVCASLFLSKVGLNWKSGKTGLS